MKINQMKRVNHVHVYLTGNERDGFRVVSATHRRAFDIRFGRETFTQIGGSHATLPVATLREGLELRASVVGDYASRFPGASIDVQG